MSIASKTRRGALLAAAIGISLMATPAAAADEPEEITSISGVCQLDPDERGLYYGHYRGHEAIPSATQVTSSGLEAQCILGYLSAQIPVVPHPGAYDGIFGDNSQASMEAYQRWINRNIDGANLGVDGLPGPQSWPYLRGHF